MDLVYELFVKLGLRYICVLRDGRYAGLVGFELFLDRSLPRIDHCILSILYIRSLFIPILISYGSFSLCHSCQLRP